jgi:hypothetical protein
VRFLNSNKSATLFSSPVVMATLAVACVVPLGAGMALAQTGPTNASAKRLESVILSPDDQRAVTWTEGRLRNARPLPIPVAKAPSGIAPRSTPPRPRSEEPPGSASAQNVGLAERKTGDPKSIPLRWAGKFGGKGPDGDYSCSAQFITLNVVLTAAHCVRDDTTGEWFKDFIFALQYQNREATQWVKPKCYSVWNQWVHGSSDNDEHWHFDYAMLLTEAQSMTGNFGWHYNYQPSDYSTAIKVGYPADILDGQVVQMDGGPLTFPEERPGIVRLHHGNPKDAEGSSGGAWVADFSTSTQTNGNHVISVTSHHIEPDKTVSYGPRFDEYFRKMLDHVRGGCKDR